MNEYFKINPGLLDLIFIITQEGYIVHFINSDQSEEQVSGKNVVNKHITEILPPEASRPMANALDKIRNGATEERFKFSIPEDVNTSHFLIIITKVEPGLSSAENKLICLIKSDSVQQDQEILIREIFDNSLSGIAALKAIRSKKSGKIVDFEIIQLNATAERLMRRNSSELIGKKLLPLLPAGLKSNLINTFKKVIHEKESINHEFSFFSEKGIQLWFNALTSKYKDGVVISFQNITKRIESEKELEKSEVKYRRFFENIRDVFYQTDINGIVTEISPSIEKYSGYSQEEVIGKPVGNFYYFTEDRVKLIEALKKKGEVIDFEVRLKTKSNDLFYTSVNAHLMINSKGEVTGIEGHMRDISVRKKAQLELVKTNEELQKLNKQKDKLFSVIAHDLKNAVAGSMGFYDLIFDEYDSLSNEELYTYLEMLRKNSNNAGELLDDLLLWSRSQFEKISFNPVHSDLSEIIESVLKLKEIAAKEKDIILKNEVEKQISVFADPQMLKTILRNLINNAIKFSHTGGIITLKAEDLLNKVNISVIDNGIGMTEEVMEKIFQKNIHYTSIGTNGEKGSGLGMDLCIDYVEIHGGTIYAKSKPDKGSTFIIKLPKVKKIPIV